MMRVIVGGNEVTRGAARRALAPRPFEELLPSSLTVEELAAMASTSTLMGDTHAYLLRGALSAKGEEEGEEPANDTAETFRDDLLDIAEGIVQSPHLFVFEEERLGAKITERLEKAGAAIELLEKAGKKESFNVFKLGNALERRDKKQLWILLMQAFRLGIAPENIAGILAWKARSMLAVARASDDRARLGALSRTLVSMYHDSHRGAGDLSLLLERWALTL